MTKQLDYPVSYIRTLLKCYDKLSEDENDRIAKVDIDMAIASLDDIEKEVVTKLNIGGYPVDELEGKFEGLNVWQIERRAIRNMAAYLNGECVLMRWGKENKLVSHGTIYIPVYLPGEIAQYVKDICLSYCVLENCPE